MKSLNEILDEMDPSLFTRPQADYDINRFQDKIEKEYDVEPIHQEMIPNVLARSLLMPKDYDEDCSYIMITAEDKTLIVKVDTKYQESDSRYMTEFELSSDSDVQSLTDMHNDLVNKEVRSFDFNDFSQVDKEHKPIKWWLPVTVIFTLLLLIGVGLFYFYFKYLM